MNVLVGDPPRIAACSQVINCDLPGPHYKVVTGIDGKIRECNQGLEVHLDQETFGVLALEQVRAENIWDHRSSI